MSALSLIEHAYELSNRRIDKYTEEVMKACAVMFPEFEKYGLAEKYKECGWRFMLANGRVKRAVKMDPSTGKPFYEWKYPNRMTKEGYWIGSLADFMRQCGFNKSSRHAQRLINFGVAVGWWSKRNRYFYSKTKAEFDGSAIVLEFNYVMIGKLLDMAIERTTPKAAHSVKSYAKEMEMVDGDTCSLLVIDNGKGFYADQPYDEEDFVAPPNLISSPISRPARSGGCNTVQELSAEAEALPPSAQQAGAQAEPAEAFREFDEATTLVHPSQSCDFQKHPDDIARPGDLAGAANRKADIMPGKIPGTPEFEAHAVAVDPDHAQDPGELHPLVTAVAGSEYFEEAKIPDLTVSETAHVKSLPCSREELRLYSHFFTTFSRLGVRCSSPDCSQLAQRILGRIRYTGDDPAARITETTIDLVADQIASTQQSGDKVERQRMWHVTFHRLVSKWGDHVRNALGEQLDFWTVDGNTVRDDILLHLMDPETDLRQQWHKFSLRVARYFDRRTVKRRQATTQAEHEFATALWAQWMQEVPEAAAADMRLLSMPKLIQQKDIQVGLLRAVMSFGYGDLVTIRGGNEFMRAITHDFVAPEAVLNHSKYQVAAAARTLALFWCPGKLPRQSPDQQVNCDFVATFRHYLPVIRKRSEALETLCGIFNLRDEALLELIYRGESTRQQGRMQTFDRYREVGLDVQDANCFHMVEQQGHDDALDSQNCTIGELQAALARRTSASYLLDKMITHKNATA